MRNTVIYCVPIFLFILFPSILFSQTVLVEQQKHKVRINSICWSPDSKVLISCDRDGIMKIWDVHKQQLVRTIRDYQRTINQVDFSNDGNFFASCGDGKIILWDALSGLYKTSIDNQHGIVENIEFHPKKKLLASTRHDTILIWQYPEGELINTLTRKKHYADGISISPNGMYLASYYSLGEILVWHIASQKITKVLGEFEGLLSLNNNKFIRFTPDGNSVITKGRCNSFLIFDWKENRLAEEISWPEKDCLIALDINLKNQVAVSGDNGDINVFSVKKKYSLYKINTEHRIDRLKWSPDGNYLAGAASDGTIYIWDKSGNLYKTLLPFSFETFLNVKLSPDGKYIAGANKENYIWFWELETGILKQTHNLLTGKINTLAFSPDSKFLLVGGKNLSILRTQTLQTKKRIINQSNPITAVEWSPDGNYFAFGDTKGIIKIWDVNSFKIKFCFDDENRWRWSVGSLCWSSDGKFLASGHTSSHYQVWNTENGILTRTYKGYNERTAKCIDNNCIRFSPTGKYIAAPTLNCENIIIWNNENGRIFKVFEGLTSTTSSLCFSFDEKYLISSSLDNKIRFWNIETESVEHEFTGGPGGICSIDMSLNGKWIVSGEYDGRIRIWEIKSGINRYTLELIKNQEDYVLISNNKIISTSEFGKNNLIKATNKRKIEAMPTSDMEISGKIPVILLND